MPRMSPKSQSTERDSLEDTMARVRGQKSYFDEAQKRGMTRNERDLLESKVGLHPRRVKKS